MDGRGEGRCARVGVEVKIAETSASKRLSFHAIFFAHAEEIHQSRVAARQHHIAAVREKSIRHGHPPTLHL
jgi:hypothetical protein